MPRNVCGQETSAAGATFFRAALSAIALAAFALELAAAGPLRTQFWGFHLKAFAPPLLAIGSSAAALAALCLLLLPPQIAERLAAAVVRPMGRIRLGMVATGALIATAATVLFWLFRSGQDLLGDAWPLVHGLPEGERFHPRQPLTAFLQQALFRGFAGFFAANGRSAVDVAKHTVAVGSVASGALFAVAALGLGWLLATSSEGGRRERPERATAVLLALILLSQGYAELFFGYLENYTFNALLIGIYLLAALFYLERRLPLAMVLFIFLVNLGLHLSSIALLPSVLFLALVGVRDGSRRLAAIRDLALGIAGAVLLNWLMTLLQPGYSLRDGLAGLLGTARTDVGGGAGWRYLLSVTHWRDFLNEHYLIGPLAAFLFLPGLLYAFLNYAFPNIRGRPDAGGRPDDRGLDVRSFDARGAFLALAALAYLAGSWAMSEPALGYARDWDLFAPASVTYTAAGLHFLTAGVQKSRQRLPLLLAAFLLSASHLACWVSVNHAEPRALARFESLPLGRGRTETVLARWHLDHGDTRAGAEWIERALRAEPDNVNALTLLGEMRLREGKPELAAQYFERAHLVRPDKLDYRESLVAALVAAKRYAAALPHFAAILERDPPRYQSWLDYGKVLAALGRDGEARNAFERTLALLTPQIEKNPADYRLNFDFGIALAWLGRMEEALASFRRSLDARPDFDAALFNAALILEQLGRTDEAHRYLERFVRAHPNHPQRDRALRWLEGRDPRAGGMREPLPEGAQGGPPNP